MDFLSQQIKQCSSRIALIDLPKRLKREKGQTESRESFHFKQIPFDRKGSLWGSSHITWMSEYLRKRVVLGRLRNPKVPQNNNNKCVEVICFTPRHNHFPFMLLIAKLIPLTLDVALKASWRRFSGFNLFLEAKPPSSILGNRRKQKALQEILHESFSFRLLWEALRLKKSFKTNEVGL